MLYLLFIFFFKQKTAYEMRISDWSSDVCSSDLACKATALPAELRPRNLCSEQRLWWAEEDLNLRPHAYQACALTTCATGPCTVTSPLRAAFRHTGRLRYRHSFAVELTRRKGHADGVNGSLNWRELFRPQGT